MNLQNLNHQLFKLLFVTTIKIVIAGLIIGYYHMHDTILAILIATYILWTFYKELVKKSRKNWLLISGMLLTGILGILAEKWGVHNQYWEYHELSNNRQLPHWLIFAWMYAFKIIYDLERKIVLIYSINSLLKKVVIAISITAFFPAFGEVITIQMGVWTYYWPFQILGVPLYAILCLVILHMFVNWVLFLCANKMKIENDLFNPKKSL